MYENVCTVYEREPCIDFLSDVTEFRFREIERGGDTTCVEDTIMIAGIAVLATLL